MADLAKRLSMLVAALTTLFAATVSSATTATAMPRISTIESQTATAVGFRRFRRGGRFRGGRRVRRFHRFDGFVFYDWKDLPKQCRKFWWLYKQTGNDVYYRKYRRCVRSHRW